MKDIFIIAEADSSQKMGTTEHDVEMVKAIIDADVDGKADVIKFQTYKSETVYVPNVGEPN